MNKYKKIFITFLKESFYMNKYKKIYTYTNLLFPIFFRFIHTLKI